MTRQQTHFGREGAGHFLEQFIQRAPGRLFIVCRERSYQASGVKAFLEGRLGANPVFFGGFSSNPKEEDVENGVRLFCETGVQAVIAVGGGSAMDMAKLINFFGSTGTRLEDYLTGKIRADVPCRPLLAIPTTSGSGSEATHFAVIYRGRTKYSVDGPSMVPGHVLLVPDFTYSLDAYQTACTGMDALAQGVESLWARAATEESRGYAFEAVNLALQHLLGAVGQPNPGNRAGMMRASHLAGCAIHLSKTTAPHAFSYILTSTFGIPHGHAVGLLLPHFAGYHAAHGIQVEGVTEPLLRDLLRRIGLVKRLAADPETLYRLLKENVNQERLGNNPVAVDDGVIRQIALTVGQQGR